MSNINHHGNQDSTTLSVDVPREDAGEEEEADISPQTDGDVDENENNDEELAPPLQIEENGGVEEEERTQLGLNSPKGKSSNSAVPHATSNTNEGTLTPNTLRYQINVNSPRTNKGSTGWSSATNNDKTQTSGSGGLSDFVTQVSRDDQQTPTNDEKTELDPKPTEKGFSFGSCFSCLLCCASSNAKEDQKHMTNAVLNSNKQESSEKTKNGGSASLGNAAAAATTTTTKSTETASEKLLAHTEDQTKLDDDNGNGNGNGNSNDNGDQDYDTDTEYSAGLLKQRLPQHRGKKCLVLDLDETLVHSSFKPISSPDFIIPVEIDNVIHRAYVLKRPFVDEFLIECAKNYEIVIFTASVAKYADPLLDKLDPHHTITHRLFRESCVLHGTAYVKDLRKIGRKLKDTIIIDNSAQSYVFQPTNAIPIGTWFDDKTDTQLRDLLPCLNTTLKNIQDVRKILNANEKTYEWLCDQHD